MHVCVPYPFLASDKIARIGAHSFSHEVVKQVNAHARSNSVLAYSQLTIVPGIFQQYAERLLQNWQHNVSFYVYIINLQSCSVFPDK